MNKDPQVPQASQEMQVCQEPQENEVSWATPLTECNEAEPNSGAYTMLKSEIMDLNQFYPIYSAASYLSQG